MPHGAERGNNFLSRDVWHDSCGMLMWRMSWPAHMANALAKALEDTQTEWGSSRWAAYRACPRKHHLAYHVGVERLGARAVHFGVGSLCHGILRYMQEGVVLGEHGRNWRDVLEYASDQPDSVPEVLDEAARLMKWYWAFWGEDNAGWPADARIIGIEQHLQTPEGAFALPHTGRADTVLDINGTIVIVDTKTRAKSLPKELDDYKLKLATRPQFLSLAAMLQMRDGLEEPPAVMVNAICKLKAPTFGRVIVPLSQRAIDEWIADHAVASARGLGDTWRNLDACAPEVGWGCEYRDWCHAMSDEARELNYVITGPR